MAGNSHVKFMIATVTGLTALLGASVTPLAGVSGAVGAAAAVAAGTPATCHLGPAAAPVRHVIYLQFDNVHLRRDNPNVPSDLEQMPNLLNFLRSGTLLTQEHTPLIAHTADDILTSETGVYGDRHGMPIANSYRYYVPGGDTHTAGSFGYWTDPIVDYDTGPAARPVGDHTPTMLDATGDNAPAPWVAYTRAGCNFGSVAVVNTELENTQPDVARVFGSDSPEAKEAANPNLQAKAAADFEGLSIHCTSGSRVCSGTGSVRDRLPAEPGGYVGYRALFGARNIDPVISPSGPPRSLYGKVIADSAGNIGFPGYDSMQAYNALAYTADMQEHGVAVTYTYLTDLHDNWATGAGMGPGEQAYEAQLANENRAFGIFFRRLAADGITPANTLFVVTADEGDHFVGGPPHPANCNGITTLCHYSRIGEVDTNLNGLVATQQHVRTPFDVEADSAPVVYVHGQPARTAPTVRQLERALGRLVVTDLATGRPVRLTHYLADPVELRLEHMLTADPKRTPTAVLFGNPDFWDQGGPANCAQPCVSEPSGGDAWNHGDVSGQINTTWLGLVGSGVRRMGETSTVWSSHTDIRPTMLTLLRLRDDYAHEGRPLMEIMQPAAVPTALRPNAGAVVTMARVFEQLDSPVGALGLASLRVSTAALETSASHDQRYAQLEQDLMRITTTRNAIVGRMLTMIEGAAFRGRPVDLGAARTLTVQGQRLIGQVETLAATGR